MRIILGVLGIIIFIVGFLSVLMGRGLENTIDYNIAPSFLFIGRILLGIGFLFIMIAFIALK